MLETVFAAATFLMAPWQQYVFQQCQVLEVRPLARGRMAEAEYVGGVGTCRFDPASAELPSERLALLLVHEAAHIQAARDRAGLRVGSREDELVAERVAAAAGAQHGWDYPIYRYRN